MKKQKKFLVQLLAFLIILLSGSHVFATNLADYVEKMKVSEDFQKYLELSDEEKSKVLMPRMYDIPKTKLVVTNPFKLSEMVGTTLEKKYTLKDDCEILPMLMEKIYLKENPSPTLERYIQYLDTKILESKNKEDYRYKIALDIQSELLEYYNANNDFEKLKTKSKKLYRKYNVK